MNHFVRPQCLAWDERKISPGKPIMHRVLAESSSHGGQTSLLTASPALTAQTLATDEDDFDFGASDPATGRQSARCGRTSPIDITDSRCTAAHRNGPTLRSSPPIPWDEYEDTVTRRTQPPDENILAWGSDEDLLDDEDDDEDDEGVLGADVFGFDVGIVEGDEYEEEDDYRRSHDDSCVDTTFSSGLRQLDEALKTVKTAERVLRSQLGRAQSEEATLRRQVMAEESATRCYAIGGAGPLKRQLPSSTWLTDGGGGRNSANATASAVWPSAPSLVRSSETYHSEEGAPHHQSEKVYHEEDNRASLVDSENEADDEEEDDEEEEEGSEIVTFRTADHSGEEEVNTIDSARGSAARVNAVVASSSSLNVVSNGTVKCSARSSPAPVHMPNSLNGPAPKLHDKKSSSRTSCRVCYACSCKSSKTDAQQGLQRQQPVKHLSLMRHTQSILTAKITPYVQAPILNSAPSESTTAPAADVKSPVASPKSLREPLETPGATLNPPVSMSLENVNSRAIAGRDSSSVAPPSPAKFVKSVGVETDLAEYGGLSACDVVTDTAVGDLHAISCQVCSGRNTRPRIPGRGVQMHEKLSSKKPTRTSSSMQQLEAKQARARTLRQRHLLERSNRVRELSKKVEEVRMQKRLLLQQRRTYLEERLHVAELKRRAELDRRVLKAHDEEIKGREIAFIQSLEAEQKQHTIFTKHEISRARLEERAEERRRRLEEKAEKEEAAKLRRRQLEAMRLAKLDALQARWVIRAQEMESRAEKTELMRRAAARAKEHNREMKLSNLENQQRAHIEELRSKIERKQTESERRHQETLRGIRRKASEMSTPTHVPADETMEAATGAPGITESAAMVTPTQKWCRVCKVLMDRGLTPKYHFQTKRHRRALLDSLPSAQRINYKMDELNAASLVDIPLNHPSPRIMAELERQKSIGKRMVSIRQRMNSRTALYRREACLSNPKSAPDGVQKQQLQKLVKEARRYYNLPESGPWVASRVSAMDRVLNSILRLLTDQKSLTEGNRRTGQAPTPQLLTPVDKVAQTVCFHLDLLPVLIGLIDLIRSQRYFEFPVVPARTITLACSVLNHLCFDNPLTCWHLLFTNDLTLLIDCLIVKLTRLETSEFHESVRSLGQGSKSRSCTAADTSSASASASLLATVLEETTCVQGLFTCLITVLKVLGTPAALNQFMATDTALSTKSSTGDTKSNCPEKAEGITASNNTQQPKTPAWFRPKATTIDFLAFISNSGLMELITARLSSPTLTNELILLGRAESDTGSASETGIPPVGTSLAFLLIEFLTATVKLLPQSTVLSPTEGRTETKTAALSAGPGGDGFKNAKPSSPKKPRTQQQQQQQPQQNADTSLSVSDPTYIFEAAAATEVFGLVAFLYGVLLCPPTSAVSGLPGVSRREGWASSESTAYIRTLLSSDAVGELILAAIRLINGFIVANQRQMQTIMGNELTCVELRNILGCLLDTCAPVEEEAGDTSEKRVMDTSRIPGETIPSASTPSTAPQANTSAGCLAGRRHPRGRSGDAAVAAILPSGTRRILPTRRDSAASKSMRIRSGDLSSRTVVAATGAAAATKNGLSSLCDQTDLLTVPTIASRGGKAAAVVSSRMLVLLHEAVICLGYLTAFNEENQVNLCRAGHAPTLLHRLLRLPVAYFSQRELADILFPTLISCCFSNPDNLALLQSELNPSLVANYIEARILENKMDSLNGQCAESTKEGAGKPHTTGGSWTQFERRFPLSKWQEAKGFFQQVQT
uniref:S phase cyclin A-associated protein in the endoplasmic reticulum n=1 Tax=Schistocephalus solidus TaxID=70667 RepID=A0A0X3P9V3_SCHSO